MYDCEECCPGAIAPVKATEAMTQPVGQRHGQLYTEPANATIEQTTGQSTTTVMSQKAVTDAVEGRVPSSSDDSISISSEGDISLAAVVDVGIVADQIGIHATDDVYIEGNNVYVNGEAYRKGHQLVQSTGTSTSAVMSQQAVTTAVSGLNDIFESGQDGVRVSQIPSVVKKTGFTSLRSSQGVYLQINANYDTYYWIVTTDTELYFGTTALAYLAICKGVNYTTTTTDSSGNITLRSSDAVRYRKSESNLPTVNNKLSVNVGDVIAVTVPTGTDETIYGMSSSPRVKDSFKEQIVEKTLKVQYSSADNGHLYVYTKTSVGYIKYDFVHSVNAAKNSNVWRIDKACALNNDLSNRFDITTYGEWECALKLKDRSDFSGGIVHGNEIMTDITFFVNGVPTDITTITELTGIDTLSIVQTSNLYDNADGTTIFAAHGSEHIFGEDVVIKQSILWKVQSVATNCYLAMHLPAKAVTDRYISNKDYIVKETTTPLNATSTKATKVSVYSSEGAVYTEMSIEDYPQGYTGGDMLLVTDNGGTVYNKCYFVICNTSSGVTIPINTYWKSTTKYKFIVGE